MARQYYIDKEKGISYDYWDGTITLDECFGNIRMIFADPDWPTKRRVHLADLRNISVDIVLDEGINKIISDFCMQNADILANMKVAILGYDVFSKGLDLKYHITQYPLSMVVFGSHDVACEWLGIDPVEAEKQLKLLRERMAKKS